MKTRLDTSKTFILRLRGFDFVQNASVTTHTSMSNAILCS